MHLPAKANSLSVQTLMANKSHSDSDSDQQPGILAMAHVQRLTPSPALIFTTAISLVVLIPGDFQSIVNYFR